MIKNDELDHSLGFLMGITYRKLSAILQQRLKEYDITPEQWSVLYHIDTAGEMIQKDIAERAGKDKSTTTRIIDHLEAKGLVQKKMSQHDRRSFLVYTTDKGKSTIKATVPLEQSVTDEVKQRLSEEQFSQLMACLHRINQFADQIIT